MEARPDHVSPSTPGGVPRGRRASRALPALLAALSVQGTVAADAGPPPGRPAAPASLAHSERVVVRVAFGVDDRWDGRAGLVGDVAVRPVPTIGPAVAWAVGWVPLDAADEDAGARAGATWSLMGGLRVGPPAAPAAPRVQLDALAGAGRRATALLPTVVVDEEEVRVFPMLRLDLRALGPVGHRLALGPRFRVDVHALAMRRDVLDSEGQGTRALVFEPRGFEAVLAVAGGVLLPGAALEWSAGGGAALASAAVFHGSDLERAAPEVAPTAHLTFGVALGAGLPAGRRR